MPPSTRRELPTRLARLLAVVCVAGCQAAPLARPRPLVETVNYSLVPDAASITLGPSRATGVYVWAHGKAGAQDQRNLPLPPHVALFNKAGFDVVRFDRVPFADDRVRATAWLRDCLLALRRRGYRRVVVGGQSRGAWNALELVDTPGLADAVLAFSPAAQGTGTSMDFSAQLDELRGIVVAAPVSPMRVAVVQFADDWYDADPASRVALLSRLRPKLGALLLIDRPPGFSGHGAANGPDFAARYGECLVRFVTGGGASC